MDKKVYISLIISAYNRKNVVAEAVESALNQDLDKKKYEIIVIKNFYSEIDKILKANKIKSVFYNPHKKEFNVAPAIKISKGEVISFLDDDDKFERRKLSTVYKLFTENPELGYYHNNYTIINHKSKIINSNIRYAQRENISHMKRIYISDKEKEKWVYSILDNGYFFNNSCVSIRKNIISRNIKMSSWGVDLLLNFSALTSKYSILYDSRKLTRYRLWNSNSSTASKNLAKLIHSTEIATLSEKKIRNMVIKQSNKKTFITALDYSIMRKELILDILKAKRRWHTIIDIIKFLKCNNKIYPLFSHKSLLFLGIFYLIFPNTARTVLVEKLNT